MTTIATNMIMSEYSSNPWPCDDNESINFPE